VRPPRNRPSTRAPSLDRLDQGAPVPDEQARTEDDPGRERGSYEQSSNEQQRQDNRFR
jgi:hypothetical protein